MTDPITAAGGSVRVALYVQPRGSRTELAGRHGDAIRIRLAAPPVDGAANEALLAFLSTCLGTAKANVRLLRGTASRRKMVQVDGVDLATVRARLLP